MKSSSLVLTPFQRALLRRLAEGAGSYGPGEVRQLAQLTIFLVLETLEVALPQIESILGPEVTEALNALVDARTDTDTVTDTGAGIGTGAGSAAGVPGADLPAITLNGRPVPYFGVVGPDGRIAYTATAQRRLQEHEHAAQR